MTYQDTVVLCAKAVAPTQRVKMMEPQPAQMPLTANKPSTQAAVSIDQLAQGTIFVFYQATRTKVVVSFNLAISD